MYSVLTPASLREAEETLLYFHELLFLWRRGVGSCFVLFLFSYCFVDTCKHLNVFFPQNCPMRETSGIRSLTATVSFKSFSSKSFSRILNNETITDALWILFKKSYFYQRPLESSWWCVMAFSRKILSLKTYRYSPNILLKLINMSFHTSRCILD